jgi:hypothetical protein
MYLFTKSEKCITLLTEAGLYLGGGGEVQPRQATASKGRQIGKQRNLKVGTLNGKKKFIF